MILEVISKELELDTYYIHKNLTVLVRVNYLTNDSPMLREY